MYERKPQPPLQDAALITSIRAICRTVLQEQQNIKCRIYTESEMDYTTISGLSINRNGWSCLCAADQQHMFCMTLCPTLSYFKTNLWEVTIIVQNCFHRDTIPCFTVHFLCFKIYSSQYRYFQLSLLSWNEIKLFPLQFQTTRSPDRGQAAQVHSTARNTKVLEPQPRITFICFGG